MLKQLLTCCIIAATGIAMSQSVSDLTGDDLFGGLKARHIGPALMSGRVSDIEGHPTNNKVIYIGTAGGGVWKSQDGGVMFNPIFDKYCQSIGTVAIDPQDPDNTIWVGTGETWTRNSTSVGDGIYLSKDGGNNWKKMGLGKSERISSIQVHPKNSNVIFVGVLGALWGDSEERGIYKTTDGGTTWTKIFYVDQKTGCSELVMDPENPDVMYAAFWEHRRTGWSFSSGGTQSALYKTIDGGKSWNKIHTGFPSGQLGRMALAIAPSSPNILYSVIESEDASKSGMYRSEDGGANWKHTNSDFELTVRPFYFSRVVVHPTNSNIVAKAGYLGSISRDGGNTFKTFGSMHPDIHDIWFDITDTDKLFTATDGGLYRSLNSGERMEMIQNLPISQFYHVAVDNQEPYNIYGGLQDNGSWFGPSRSPGGVEARDWEVIGVGDGFRVYPHPTQPHIMYSEMQGAETIWRYDHKIRQTKVITPFKTKGDPKLRYNWNAPITTSSNNPDRLYVGSQFVHVSNDKGDTWTKISPDLTTNNPLKLNQAASGGLSVDNSGAENHCTIFTIAESSLDQQVIWVGTDDGNVQVTQDGGKSWSNVTAGLFTAKLPANTWCYHIEASVFDKGTAYAVFDGHTKNDGKTYCYKTTDFGKTWTSLADKNVYGFARSFQEDYKNKDLLFLGTEFGLYISVDGGSNWMKFENNMPATAVHYIELHPKTHDLILGTHGRGIIILDDISPLRQITDKIISEEVHFMEMPIFYMDEESTFGGTSGETQFVGANPTSGARISYFMAKRHTFGKMRMKVVDKDGDFVANLSAEKKKGLNLVYWNFYGSSPKAAGGKTFSAGSMFSPRVAAGTYTIVIEKGKETFETKIEVAYPRTSVFTLEERKRQESTTTELFNLNEELAYLVYEIEEWTKHAQEQAKVQPKLAKVGAKLATTLEAFRADLVITTGDNYVGRAENKLREDLGDMFSTIGGNFGPPTASQLEGVDLIKERMQTARDRIAKIRVNELKVYQAQLEKLSVASPTLVDFKEFVKKD